MEARSWLAVTTQQTLRFFFERLRDVSEDGHPPRSELLYNASVLAHFATTSTASSSTSLPAPTSLVTVFDLFVLDRSLHADAEIMESAGAQCLLLTGFFGDQHRRRHNVKWYASLGAGFYASAAQLHRHRERAKMMTAMSEHFDFWRQTQARLAVELREDSKLLLHRPPVA
jgi:hypothetical protein